jgi:hypothetical protein
METTVAGTLAGLVAGLFFTLSSFVDDSFVQRWSVVAGQIVAVIGAIFVIRIAGLEIRVARAVWGGEATQLDA